MSMLVGYDVYGGVLDNGEPYSVKLNTRYSYPDIYIIESSLTQNEKKVGYANTLVLDAPLVLDSQPMLYEVSLAVGRVGGFDKFKELAGLKMTDRVALICDVKLSERAVMTGYAEMFFDKIEAYLRAAGQDFNRILYTNSRLARPRCKNPEVEKVHTEILSAHPEFTVI